MTARHDDAACVHGSLLQHVGAGRLLQRVHMAATGLGLTNRLTGSGQCLRRQKMEPEARVAITRFTGTLLPSGLAGLWKPPHVERLCMMC